MLEHKLVGGTSSGCFGRDRSRVTSEHGSRMSSCCQVRSGVARLRRFQSVLVATRRTAARAPGIRVSLTNEQKARTEREAACAKLVSIRSIHRSSRWAGHAEVRCVDHFDGRPGQMADSMTVLRYAGPPGTKRNIAVLGDGFAAADQDDYNAWVDTHLIKACSVTTTSPRTPPPSTSTGSTWSRSTPASAPAPTTSTARRRTPPMTPSPRRRSATPRSG